MKKTLKVVGNILLWLFVAFAVVITVLAFAAQSDSDGIPSLGGKCMLSVLTNSMEPNIMTGDLIIGQKLSETEKNSLQVGDVVTFHMDEVNLNTHRIVEVHDGYYITKGDNEEANIGNVTETVNAKKIIAKWTGKRYGKLGSALAFLQKPTGFLVVIVIPLVLFFIWELYKFIRTALAVKNEGKKQITAADEEMIKQKAIEEYLRQQKEAEEKAADNTENKPEDDFSEDAEKAETEEKKDEDVKDPFDSATEPENPAAVDANETAETAEPETAVEEAAETAEVISEAAEDNGEMPAEEIAESTADAVAEAETISEAMAEEVAQEVTETEAEAEEKVAEEIAEEAIAEEAIETVETVTEEIEKVEETVETEAEAAAETVTETVAEVAEETEKEENE